MIAGANTDVAINEAANPREIQMKKVQRLSRIARGCCTAIIVLMAVTAIAAIVLILRSPLQVGTHFDLGSWSVKDDQVNTWQMKITLFIFVGVTFALISFFMNHLNRLFGNFARGAIYTKENVQHILQAGRVWLYGGIFGIFWPVFAMIPLWTGFVDQHSVLVRDYSIRMGSITSILVPGGLIILLAWIMDVGRQTQDEATNLREEAELTV